MPGKALAGKWLQLGLSREDIERSKGRRRSQEDMPEDRARYNGAKKFFRSR